MRGLSYRRSQRPATRCALSSPRQYGFGSLMLWLVYFMGLFLVYILGSWLPTLVKAVEMTVSQAAIMTAIYQAGGTSARCLPAG